MLQQITTVEPITRHRYRIYVDDEAVCILSAGQMREWNIEVGRTLSEDDAKNLFTEISRMAAQTAMNCLMVRDYSEAELYRKLLNKGFAKEYAAYGISYVRSYHYTDDLRYACQLAKERKGRVSRRQICALMQQKGLDMSVIEEALEESAWEDDAGIEHEILKKYREVDEFFENSEKDRQKFLQFLVRKGYDYADIRRVIHNLRDFKG